MVFRILASTLLMLGLSLSAQAQVMNECAEGMLSRVGGFTIGGSKLQILREKRFASYTNGLSREQIISRIRGAILKGNSNPRGTTVDALASEIYLAADSWGVDPFIFTAIVWNESVFNVDALNRGGGDSGLTQMTSAALDELREQYKKNTVGAVLYEQSDRYFNALSPDDWVSWVTAPGGIRDKGATLRNGSRALGYALASGASLLKIYLAVKNGNYRQAITQYNGGGVRNYYGHINGRLQQIDSTCNQEAINANIFNVLEKVCSMADSQDGCADYVNELDRKQDSVVEYEI